MPSCSRAASSCYELKSAFLHSKSIVVDGVWSSIGSTNFDWRSFVHNNEISVCVIDKGFAQQMARMFDTDLADSKQITPAAWKKRGFKRALQRTDVAAASSTGYRRGGAGRDPPIGATPAN